MRSVNDCASETPDQLFQSIAALLATSIVRLHVRGVLDRAEQPSPSQKTSKNAQDCLE
jgi:hypothetical protein